MFRPERWFRGSEERNKKMEQDLELVFRYGKWQCLGKDVARMELNKGFVEVNLHFFFLISSYTWGRTVLILSGSF